MRAVAHAHPPAHRQLFSSGGQSALTGINTGWRRRILACACRRVGIGHNPLSTPNIVSVSTRVRIFTDAVCYNWKEAIYAAG